MSDDTQEKESQEMVWIHHHGDYGRDVFTHGEDFPECPKERRCWQLVPKELAEALLDA